MSDSLAQKNEAATGAVTKVRRVLHIDDDPQITELVAAKLKSYGFEVESLNDERLWEEKIQQDSQRVVLLDLDMPYFSGAHLLRKIKKFDGTIQVILLTSHVRIYVVLDSLRDGAEYCFFKPILDFDALAQALNNTCARLDHWRNAVKEARLELLKQREPTTGYRGAGLQLNTSETHPTQQPS